MWLWFAASTVLAWGLYGVFLHSGQSLMQDPENGRYKAFLFVGLAYVLTAVVAPLVVLMVRGASMEFPAAGIGWSFLAGIMGAVGAFCVLLAFGVKGHPVVVMSIIFAGAPVVNALYALIVHPSLRGAAGIRWPFVLGIMLAALGGFLVTRYKPAPKAAPAPAVSIDSTTPGASDTL